MSAASKIVIPFRGRGRPSAADQVAWEVQVAKFRDGLVEIASGLDFRMSARGWCYFLEDHGLDKGNFDYVERLINDLRKDGKLPLEICAVDDRREAEGVEQLHDSDPHVHLAECLKVIRALPKEYRPFSRWEGQESYVEMAVEKIDLKSLFAPICEQYSIPISNFSGWSYINGRAAMMRRFAEHQRAGRRPVLLYCGDHDPGGLHISEFLRSNFEDLSLAVGWRPTNLIVDRFGLNYGFIKKHRLTWIDGLTTGSKNGINRLDDPDHGDHLKAYVQSYLKQFGARKVEANALVRIPQAARDLCESAILKYFDTKADARNRRRLAALRNHLRSRIDSVLGAA